MTFRPSQRTALYSAGMALLGVVAATAAIMKNRTRRVPRYRRRAITRPVRGRNSTAWRQILTFGGASDFIVTVNITKELLVRKLLPLFDQERVNVNFGSPYRTSSSARGRRPF